MQSLLSIWREDWQTNRASGLTAFLLLATYRLGHHCVTQARGQTGVRRLPYRLLAKLLRLPYVALCHSFGCFIPWSAAIGRRVLFKHAFYGVFISQRAVIGDEVTIFHHVTLGSTDETSGNPGAPTIGNGVLIGAGAMVIGNVRVGDGARIGANATAVKDVAAQTTVVSAPARVIGQPSDPVAPCGEDTIGNGQGSV